MRLGLFWKLMLAFAVVVLVSLSAVILIANQVTADEFHRFMLGEGDGQGNMMGQGAMMGRGLTNTQQAVIDRVNGAVVLGGALAMLATLGIGFVLFRGITQPVAQLKQAAQSISGGDLSTRVEIGSGDELAELGSTFNAMAANLQRDEQLRRDMTADVAHELRTPLTVLQSNLEAMLDGVYPMDADHLTGVLGQTKLLSRLVDDLRTLALAEAGQLPLERRPVDVASLATTIAEAFRPRATEKGVTIEVDRATDLPRASLDPQRMSQVLSNLLENALRYTPHGGRIAVGARRENSQRVVLSVSDSGNGISAEDLPFIFERFYRADKSRARAEGGSGLGLAIAKSIVEAHDGSIRARSEAGSGTTFEISLPVA